MKGEYKQKGTISQLIDEGVPSYKLVLGKTISRVSAGSGSVSPANVGVWTSQAYD